MIQDSGERRQFESGAVRDIQEGKGRCDLLPLDVVAPLIDEYELILVVSDVDEFMKTGDDKYLYRAITTFAGHVGWCRGEAILEVSKHYEEGAQKYGEHNWEKGIPLHCYIDSGVRHLLKYLDKVDDERHDRAFIWNMLGAIWTLNHKPELDDIVHPEKVVDDKNSDDATTSSVSETSYSLYRNKYFT